MGKFFRSDQGRFRGHRFPWSIQHILVNITKDEEKQNAKVQRRIIRLNDYFGSQGSNIAFSDHSIDP